MAMTYDEAIRLSPDDAVFRYNRGGSRQDMGDLDGAVADFDEAIRLDPNFPHAYKSRMAALKAKEVCIRR